MPPRYRLTRLWLAIGWGLIVVAVWLSLTPRPELAIGHLNDKAGHLLAYAGLMTWWGQIARRGWRLAGGLLLFGLAMEIAQGLVPGREPSALDMLANGLGLALGLAMTYLAPGWLAWIDARLAPRRA